MSLQRIISGSFVVGQSQTNAVTLNELTLVGFTITGSSISGSQVSFLVSTDGTDYYPLINSSGTEITITSGSIAKAYDLDEATFFPWNFVKARLGTSASAVLQATNNQLVKFNAKLL